MKISHRLALGFAALVGVFGASCFVLVSTLRTSVGQFNRDQETANAAFEYERGAMLAETAAYLFVERSPEMGRQTLEEGRRAMSSSRERLLRASAASDGSDLREMERVEKLTLAAIDELVPHAGEDDAALIPRLRVVESRVQALALHTNTLSARTRETAQASLATVSSIQRQVVLGGLGSMALAIVIAIALSRRVTKPIAALGRGVARVRAGDLKSRIALDTGDEFAALSTAFDEMSANLETTMGELERRTQEMSRVLANVSQGLVMIDKAGVMASERSRAFDEWFGAASPGATIWDHLEPRAAHTSAYLKLGWEMLNDDFMPLEVVLDQLPKRTSIDGSTFDLEYRPIQDSSGALTQVLLVVSNVTQKLAAERADAEQRAMLASFERIMRDKSGFLDFFEQASALVSRITGGSLDPVTLRREIHTLKGNAGIFQLSAIAEYCHELEDRLGAEGDLGPSDAAGLIALWESFAKRIERMLGESGGSNIAIDDEEYAQILAAVAQGHPRKVILAMIRAWRYEPVTARLDRLGEVATSLAQRLEKGPIEVKVEADKLRLPKDEWAPLWSALVHVVRNAVDHGIESNDERRDAGKGAPAVALRARSTSGQIVIEIADDGRGVDWAAIREKARAYGLAHATQADLERALFADGLSTRDVATDVSGRGVGTGAVLAEVQRLGGSVQVESRKGHGSTFRFRIPVVRQVDAEGEILRSILPPAA